MSEATTTIITADDIGALLDELAHSLADMPGRTPQDAQIANILLAYVMTGLQDESSRMFMNTLERRGVDADEARRLALALAGLALRLGAWLGRAER